MVTDNISSGGEGGYGIRHRVHHHISGCHSERLRERRGESTLSNNVPNGELWWENV
jgi:hypothetical protein